MKRFMAFVVMSCIIVLSGCITVSKYEKERQDQQLSGNQGYISGSPSRGLISKGCQLKTRTVYEVEIELPDLTQIKEHQQKKAGDTEGNRGYLRGGRYIPQKKEKTIGIDKTKLKKTIQEEPFVQEAPVSAPVSINMRKQKPAENKVEKITTYKVKEMDSLWNIAGYPQVYGNSLKWRKIYEANKDKIKDPNRIYPGQVLIIPED